MKDKSKKSTYSTTFGVDPNSDSNYGLPMLKSLRAWKIKNPQSI